jgi:hypothetical protein
MSEGLGVLKEEPKAIFYQKSKSLQAEFGLISLVTLREKLVESLKKLVQDMAVGTRKVDSGCVTEFFTLIHKVREATYDLVEGTLSWQTGFTQNIRPQLMSVDYLVDMITSMMFVSGSSLKRTFAFSLGPHGNIFMLPHPVVTTTKPPNKCDDNLFKMVTNFAAPDELRMINCYKILKNCVPAHAFDRLHPIEHWMNNKWKPHICSARKVDADRWYLTGGDDADEAPVHVHKNFLRRKKKGDDGLEKKGGGKEEGGGGAETTTATTAVAAESKTSAVADATRESHAKGDATGTAATPAQSAVSSPTKYGGQIGEKNAVVGEDSDDEDNLKPKINFREIIENTFKGASVENFGAYVPIKRSYAQGVDYTKRENRNFSVDALLEKCDKLGRGDKNKKPNYLKDSQEKLKKKNAFEEAEQERIKAELAALRASKGTGKVRARTPPKTTEEAAERLRESGVDSETLRLSWQETHK